MKRTRKLILALVVVMSLLMAMAVAIIPASAAATRVIYLDPGPWNVDGAKFVAYSWGGNDGAKFTEVSYDATSKLYMCKIDPTATKIIFLRKSAATLDWNNEWNRVGDIVLPTDTNNLCTVTGWSKTSYKWSHQDVWDSGKVTNNATCVATGTKTYTCTVSGCGKTKTETIAKLSHSYTGEYTYDAENDTHAQLCVNGCGKANPTATACKFNTSAVTSPDCVNGGYTTHSCVCGNSYTDSETPAGGHNYVGVVTTEPGCETEGETTYTCSGCNDSYTEKIDKLNHKMAEATCTAPSTCERENCGHTVGEELGHDLVDVAGEDATCTEAGYTAYKDCSRCDHIEGKTEIPATGHNHVNNICTVCGHAEYIYIYFQNNWLWSDVNVYYWNANDTYNAAWPGAEAESVKNDGSYDIYLVKIPTDFNATGIIFNGVKNDGSGDTDQTPDIKDFATCSVYSMKWDNGNKVDVKVAHNYTESVTNEATCTEAGLKTFTCLCGDTYTEEIPATGHTYRDGVCNCGEKIDVLEKNSEGVIVLGADFNAQGTIVFTENSVINLNGKTLTANGVITFHETTRFVGEGKLVIPQNGLILAGETNNMPVWNAEGYYTFPTVRTQFVEEPKVIDHDSFNVVFRPTLNDSTKLNQSVFADANAHGLTFRVEIYGKGKAEALYSGNVSNALIAEAYANGKAISLTVNGADTDYEEYTVKLVVVSSTGLVNTTEIGKFIPTEAPEVEETPADAN